MISVAFVEAGVYGGVSRTCEPVEQLWAVLTGTTSVRNVQLRPSIDVWTFTLD